MTVAWEPHERKPRKGKYFYRVQGLDATFDTKARDTLKWAVSS